MYFVVCNMDAMRSVVTFAREKNTTGINILYHFDVKGSGEQGSNQMNANIGHPLPWDLG